MRFRSVAIQLAICSWLLGIGAMGSPVFGAEPARQFLEGLRERGYSDMALEYLERMETSPLAPVSLREVLPYERSITLIEVFRTERDERVRKQLLDEAQQQLTTFIERRSGHPLVFSARIELGNLLVERGKMTLEEDPDNDARRAEARRYYEEAYQLFQGLVEEIRGRLMNLPANISQQDRELLELREQLRADYLQVSLLSPAVREEMADTYADDAEQRGVLLRHAIEQYADFYDRHHRRLAGLYAKMYIGRCYKKLGDCQQALTYFEDLLEQPDNPEPFRVLKTRTFELAVPCWQAENQHAQLIARLSDWIDKARPNESRQPDFLELRLTLAKAQLEYAQQLRENDPRDRQSGQLIREARRHAQFLSHHGGALQSEARRLLAETGGGEPLDDDRPEVTTFAEAQAAGRKALETMMTAKTVLDHLPAQIRQAGDEEVRQELEQQLERSRATLAQAQNDAMHFYRQALRLADDEVESSELNSVRSFLAYAYYNQELFHEAAVLGEFVARRYPDIRAARQSARIAMAAYAQLVRNSEEPEKSFATQRLMDVCQYIVGRWSDQPEGSEALNTLIPLLIQHGELDQAQQYVQQLPENSPHRGRAELRVGQALWASYLQGSRQVRQRQQQDALAEEDVDLEARQEELEQLRRQAQQTLAGGVDRMKDRAQVDETLATAALSLAQIYVDTEQAEQAIRLLEDEMIGPLTLVQNNHPAVQRDGYAAEAHKLALRGYIASLGNGNADAEQAIAKATEVMDDLRLAVGEDAQDQQQLVAIYVSLARDLQRQMERISSPEARQAQSRGFETFLNHVAEQADDFTVLHWVAETFYGMGEAFDEGTALSEPARNYFAAAARTYERILERAQDDPQWVPSDQMKIQTQLRLAAAKRRLGQFQVATDMLAELLQERPTQVTVQIEAARTYQQWAAQPDADPKLYESAIRGARRDSITNRNIIWGWGRIADMTSGREAFRDVFFEARLNVARSRYEYAMRQEGSEDLLRAAKRDIELTARLYPSMGGETWKVEFDDLLRRIQSQLGERTIGLAAFEPAGAAAGG